MTCEVAVMNTLGIALAADSAVTLGEGQKIYLTAEKLFELASPLPVAVMTYGGADLAGVPWATIVAGYRKHLGDRRFDTLADYLSDFVAFIEAATTMFPNAQQQESFADVAARLWYGLYARPWKEELDSQRTEALNGERPRDGDDPYGLLRRRIAENNSEWEQRRPLERVDPHFADSVIADYDNALKERERAVFQTDKLPADIRRSLRKSLRLLLSRLSGRFPGGSGLIIAGIGEAEHFPGLLHYYAGPVVKGRLRLQAWDSVQITPQDSAYVIPFAQRATIDTIISGINPELRDDLPGFVSDSLDEGERKASENGILKRFRDRLDQEIRRRYDSPLVGAVDAMPRLDLAAMAEVLVSLTVFRSHASVEQETVAGPIDVALLSKGEGFVWIKRKQSAAA